MSSKDEDSGTVIDTDPPQADFVTLQCVTLEWMGLGPSQYTIYKMG